MGTTGMVGTMGRSRWLLLTLVLLSACTQKDELFCDADTPCTDPARPFCDIDGAYPASDGVRKTCIPDPGVIGGDCTGDGECSDPLFPVCEVEQCRECRDAAQCGAAAPVCADYSCGPCSLPADCAAHTATPFCGAAGACVQCEDSGDCSGTTPVCSAAGACEACTAHDQCDSGLCQMDTGACVDEAAIAYVTTDGTGDACTQAAPCASVQAGIDAAKPNVLVGAGTYSENLSIVGVTVNVVGPGAIVSADTTGEPALLIGNGTTAAIEGLTFRDGHGGTDGDGIRCVRSAGAAPVLGLKSVTVSNNSGQGIEASGCTVTLEQSTLTSNAGGGLRIDSGSLAVRNSFIVANGGPVSLYGGIAISGTETPNNVVEFSTVADNFAGSAAAALGIQCSSVGMAISLRGLIVSGTGDQVHTTGPCSGFTNSNLSGVPAAGTNLSAAPRFVDAPNGNYHLAADDPGIDQGGTTSLPATDFDGDPRPQGTAADIGADERVP